MARVFTVHRACDPGVRSSWEFSSALERLSPSYAEHIPVPTLEQLAAHPNPKSEREKWKELHGARGRKSGPRREVAMFGPSLFDEDHSLYAKDRITRHFVRAKVLITVKSIPQPSATYGDTVCVAGIWIDNGQMKWVRLYPIPFRSMDELDQFKKYELIEVPVLPNSSDFRPESYKPDRDKIARLGKIEGWPKRHQYIAPLADRWTMCGIQAKAREGLGADSYPSLAVIKPKEIIDFQVSRFRGWTDKQKKNVEFAFSQDDLFSLDQAPRRRLEEPRFEAQFVYTCAETSCKSHTQSFIDWELEALSRRLRSDSENVAVQKIRDKFLHTVCKPEAKPLFFVGNIKANPRAYNVLGIYRSNG